MKILFVTSEVTYVPRNYQDLFEEALEGAGEHVAGLAVMKGLSFDLLKTTGGLFFLGAKKVGLSLTRNILELPLKRREKLFEDRGLPILRAASMNSPEIINWVRTNEIDLVVNLRTRCIYKSPILNAPRLGCLNIHHGILPRYRGTLCDLYALSEGRPAGFTIHVMTEKLDAGRILVRKEVSDGTDRDYVSYLSRTGREEGRSLATLINEIARTGKLPEGTPNKCENVVFTKTPRKRIEIQRLRAAGIQL